MTTLNPKARALIQAARSASRATAADRDRIESALRTRLGSDALPSDGGVSRAASTAGWKAVVGLGMGVCALGAVAFVALRPAASVVPSQPHSSASRPTSEISPSPPLIAAADAVPARPAVISSSKPPAKPSRATDRLAREVALLSRAVRDLRDDRAADALKALAEHQRSFPNGSLSEERRVAKAQALCRLGRVREGRAELAGITPASPTAARATEVCGGSESSGSGERK
jgi:hypothetical protein